MAGKSPVLLVEANREEAPDLARALRECKCSPSVQELHEVEFARQYLMGNGEYADRQRFPFPRLLLISLDLENRPGMQFLEWLNSENDLSKLPVIALLPEHDPGLIQTAYDLGANSCLVKPPTLEKRRSTMQLVCDYWLKLNQCPEI